MNIQGSWSVIPAIAFAALGTLIGCSGYGFDEGESNAGTGTADLEIRNPARDAEVVAFGLNAGDLPAGYALVGPGVVDTAPAPAARREDGDRSVTAEVFSLATGGTAAVLAGRSHELEWFLPAQPPSSTVDLGSGRAASFYDGLPESGRVIFGVHGSTEGTFDAVVVSHGSVEALTPFVAAVSAGSPPGELVASGSLDVFAALVPGAVGTYNGPAEDDDIVVATFHGAGLDPVLRYVAAQPEDVTVDGHAALAFHSEDSRSFVAWEPQPGELVLIVAPDALGRPTLLHLAEAVRAVEPVMVPSDGSAG